MKLGLFTRAFEDLNFEEMTRIISHRYSAITQLELTANYGSKHINILNPDISSIQKCLNSEHLAISNLSIHRDSQLLLGARGSVTKHFFPGNEHEQKEYAKHVLYKCADVAKELAIPVVVGNIGCENFSDLFDWPIKTGWQNQLEVAKAQWMPILEYYNKKNIKYAHELGPQQLAYDLETALLLLETFENIDSFGFCIDPSQLLYTGVNIPLVIEKLNTKVFHFHAKDAEFNYTKEYSGILPQGSRLRTNRGYRNRIPGWGDIEWKKVLTSLKSINYNGPISIEIDDVFCNRDEAINKSIHFLNPLLFI